MNQIKKDVVLKIVFAIKIILSLFITYGILYKGDAGRLIHNIGSFIQGGNSLFGLLILVNLLTICSVLVNIFTEKYKFLQKIKNTLITSDIILILCTFGIGILTMTAIQNMPVNDALNRISILICGAAPIYLLTSIITIIFAGYTQAVQLSDSDTNEPEINNNPFLCKGRITRLPYFITKCFLSVVFIVNIYLMNLISFENLPLFCLTCLLSLFYIVLSLFVTNKRLNDIKWNKFLIFVWLIPYIGIVIGLPLFFVKSKYITNEKQEQ